MHLSKSDLEATERKKRLNLINAISGIKPGNLIGSISNTGQTNLAIFSSVVHLGSNPGYLGFIVRPDSEVRRHTYENITENGYYTINHILNSFAEKAHYTSAKFEANISEFEACKLSEEYLFDFKAPFVKESTLKMGLKHIETVTINTTNTVMVVGEIQHLILPDEAVEERGYLDLGKLDVTGISGLNCYYKLTKINEFPYARVNEVPDFKK